MEIIDIIIKGEEIKMNSEINQDKLIPNGTILIKCGKKFEVTNFRAEYTLKEVEPRHQYTSLHIGTDTIGLFKIYEEDKENRTYEELEASIESLQSELRKANKLMDRDFEEKQNLKAENSRLQVENNKLTDKIHNGFGEKS